MKAQSLLEPKPRKHHYDLFKGCTKGAINVYLLLIDDDRRLRDHGPRFVSRHPPSSPRVNRLMTTSYKVTMWLVHPSRYSTFCSGNNNVGYYAAPPSPVVTFGLTAYMTNK